jgi:hypothetical protein
MKRYSAWGLRTKLCRVGLVPGSRVPSQARKRVALLRTLSKWLGDQGAAAQPIATLSVEMRGVASLCRARSSSLHGPVPGTSRP